MSRISIDPLTERVLPLKDLGKLLPGRPRYTTILEWCNVGRINHYTRRRVRMEMIQLPAGFASSLEAYGRFVARLNALK